MEVRTFGAEYHVAPEAKAVEVNLPDEGYKILIIEQDESYDVIIEQEEDDKEDMPGEAIWSVVREGV